MSPDGEVQPRWAQLTALALIHYRYVHQCEFFLLDTMTQRSSVSPVLADQPAECQAACVICGSVG